MLNRQTDRQTYKAVERQIRANLDMRQFVLATYPVASPIGQLARCKWNDDELKLKALEIELFGASWYQTALKQFKAGR